MDKNTALDAISRFRIALSHHGVEATRIVLYGSYARGDWREWSDIDLIVISPNFEDKEYWDRIEILSKAICDVWEPIEAVAMTPEEWEKGESMIAQLARDGETVFSQ